MSDTLRGAWRQTLSLTWHTLRFRASFIEDLRYRAFKTIAWVVIIVSVMINAEATGRALAPCVLMLTVVSVTRAIRRWRKRRLTRLRPRRSVVLVQINRIERETSR